ncbi:gliding motility-associated C-terminal domain-containing protein [Flavobacterium cupreum]|uniref:Gliding motility-associated C-terminal domain-containing protein n=1 Tax=Flavobacterium cupreum TaxID=2133766 RepID=A0A434A454_9FLAO|nr:T9SS type B sorting domain-containing protein [Flavobacterium cupreum]RUT69094.1 gliding motility-associated C-terminal domain-containing protein [Flavobacterium cupreum]
MKRILLFLLLLIFMPVLAQNQNQSVGFKENKGQITDQKGKPNKTVKYLLNTGGLNVQLRKNGFSYDIYEVKKTQIVRSNTSKERPSGIPDKDRTEQPDYTLEYLFHRIDIDFVNSNSKVELLTDQQSKDFDNYYNIPNKPEGITGIHQYKQITYKNIYPNIDVVFTIPEDSKKTVEYNFVVHPKGKISDIQLKFKGAETDLADNKIRMNVRFGKMEETLPASWIEDGTGKKEISIAYRKIKKDVYGFTGSESVSDKTVIIDPVPTRLWGTFYGDEEDYGANEFGGIATDLSGNNYLVGFTSVPNSSYATSGAHQTTIGNPDKIAPDGILVKFSPDGRKLWATYYGGEEYDRINAVKTDNQNNVIIVGKTNSKTNISTAGSYSSSFGGYDDGFLVKFNSSGTRLWGTYYGGKDNDESFDVDIDKNNNIFMVGRFSINHSENIFDTPIGDGFIAKFNPNGNILWNKLYGGKGTDEFRSIKVGENFIVTGGLSYSSDNISTPGVFQENLNYIYNLSNDGIVFKLNLDGDRIWSTYYGGESGEKIHAVEIDDENNIYIGGETTSSNTIASPNSFDDYNLYSWTGFLAKLDQNGQRLWGTFLGRDTIIYSLVFTNNSIYVGGNGGIDNSITTVCAYKRTGMAGGYMGKFSKSGNLIWGSYAGGFDQYSQTEITVKNNEIIVGGTSSMNDGITDANSYQPEILGRKNFYLMKFSEENNCNINANPGSNSPVCIGATLNFTADSGYNYLWTGPNNFTSTLQNPTITNVSGINNGDYHLKASDYCGCEKNYDLKVVIGDIEAPVPDLENLTTITGDCTTTITTFPTATDACAGAITGTTTDLLSYNLPGTYTIVWNYDDGNGNKSSQNQTITISSQPLPAVTSPQTFCIQENATINNISVTNGQNIKWYDAATAGALLPNTTVLQNDKTYYVSQTINGCESERAAINIKIQDTPVPTGDTNQPFCTGQDPTLDSITVNGEDKKWYDALTNGNNLPDNTSLQNGKTYYVSQTLNLCESKRLAVTISLQNTPSVPSGDLNPKFCKSENATLNSIGLNGQNIKWYDSTIAAGTLSNTTLLENNKTYYASQTVGCESERIPVLVKIYDTPFPGGINDQQFCIDEKATIANLNFTGTARKWYDAPANGNILPETNLLQNGIYYVTQTLNNCESERFAVSVKIQDTQSPMIDSPQIFCIQQNSSIEKIKIKGDNIKWYDQATAGMILTESTPLENGVTYYASQTVNECESERTPVTIKILGATTAECINYVDELPFPKFFTPNNDGHNDTWTIDFSYLAPRTGIRIFDRYGKFLKELTTDTSWDGTYIGRDEPASDYWFVVTRLNGTEFRGHFSLKR